MFDSESSTPLGALLDLIIRKANLMELSDCLVGVQLDYDKDVASIYFSDNVEEELLKALQENLAEQEQMKVSFEKTTEGGAAWVLRVRQIPEDVTPVAGDVGVKVALQGDLLNKGTTSQSPIRNAVSQMSSPTTSQVPITRGEPTSMQNANSVSQM